MHFPALIYGFNPLQLVHFGDDIEKTSFGNVIFVINLSSSDEDQIADNPERGVLKICTDVLWF